MDGDMASLFLGRVIGDVLDPFMPKVEMTVKYNSTIVRNGYGLPLSEVAAKPTVEILGGHFWDFFTLVMVDPDAPRPSDPHFSDYMHWLVTDIHGLTDDSFGGNYGAVRLQDQISESIGMCLCSFSNKIERQ